MSGCPLGKKEESPNYAECENETTTQRRQPPSTAHRSTSEGGGLSAAALGRQQRSERSDAHVEFSG